MTQKEIDTLVRTFADAIADMAAGHEYLYPEDVMDQFAIAMDEVAGEGWFEYAGLKDTEAFGEYCASVHGV